MASPSIKKSQPKPRTGAGQKVSNEKAHLRGGETGVGIIATRPAVPDDFNRVDRPYDTWQPGQVRSFQSVHRFNLTEPKMALCKGPAKSVEGKLDGIKSENSKMGDHRLFGKNGWSK